MAKIDVGKAAERNELRKLFLDGDISEPRFVDCAEEACMPPRDIEGWLAYVRAQDGGLS
jgi:hypothetical protein